MPGKVSNFLPTLNPHFRYSNPRQAPSKPPLILIYSTGVTPPNTCPSLSFFINSISMLGSTAQVSILRAHAVGEITSPAQFGSPLSSVPHPCRILRSGALFMPAGPRFFASLRLAAPRPTFCLADPATFVTAAVARSHLSVFDASCLSRF